MKPENVQGKDQAAVTEPINVDELRAALRAEVMAEINDAAKRGTVRFLPVVGQTNAKSPKFRAQISLQGAFTGTCMEAPIYKDADTGKFGIPLPGGGRFAVLKAEPQIIEHNGQPVMLAEPLPEGADKINRFEEVILTAFYNYQTSKNPVQSIRF